MVVFLASMILYAVTPEKIKERIRSQRWMSFWTIVILLSLGGFLFGVATGYYGVWWDHQFDPAYTGTHGASLLAFAGAPGDVIANSYGGDWQQDEAWDYRIDITVWNGLFWVGLTIVALAIIQSVPDCLKKLTTN